MKLTNVKGKTWVLDGPQLVGVYQLDDTRCLLLDPGSWKLIAPIETALKEVGWTPVGVACTHMHYPGISKKPMGRLSACRSWRRTSCGTKRA